MTSVIVLFWAPEKGLIHLEDLLGDSRQGYETLLIYPTRNTIHISFLKFFSLALWSS